MQLSRVLENRGYLVAYCLASYLIHLVVSDFFFVGTRPEIEMLIALFGAPVFFYVSYAFGTPFFALTHTLWTSLLFFSVMQWFLLGPEFRWGDMSQAKLLNNAFFGTVNLLGLVWLVSYCNQAKPEDVDADP